MKGKIRFISWDVVFLTLVFIISIGYSFKAFDLSWGSVRMPSAGFLPRITGVSASVLSFALIITNIRKIKNIKTDERETDAYPHKIRLLWFVASFIVYVLIFRSIGYVISTILFTFILSKVMDNTWLVSAIIGILTGIAFFIIFSLLSVPLPMGILTGLKLF